MHYCCAQHMLPSTKEEIERLGNHENNARDAPRTGHPIAFRLVFASMLFAATPRSISTLQNQRALRPVMHIRLTPFPNTLWENRFEFWLPRPVYE